MASLGHMKKIGSLVIKVRKCSICNKLMNKKEWGHNPQPVSNFTVKDRCCDYCNTNVVIPKRMENYKTDYDWTDLSDNPVKEQ
jgi:hypothetical protein